MAGNNMDQDRRDAMHWAEEWRIKQRNRKILLIVCVIVAIALLGFIISFVTIKVSRTTFESEEAMKAALQGRYETDYAEDIVIEGDKVTLTYYNQSHYDLEYAEKYGYSEYDDSVYEDKVVKWDYRRGVIELEWMSELKVDKDGNVVYYEQTYRKTNDPKPTPLDPSLLSQYRQGYEDGLNADGESEDDGTTDDAASGADLTDEEKEAQDAVQESQEETQAAAEEAGVEPLPETGDDV
jgi:hypothetical protein